MRACFQLAKKNLIESDRKSLGLRLSLYERGCVLAFSWLKKKIIESDRKLLGLRLSLYERVAQLTFILLCLIGQFVT
ncbi:MAG: hypothetical protein DRR08_04475 [Candidatus Parabeggiatoa sp. nov. 2]|nr:MAG: hypothetical protein B6247_10615 [Beggiatoa sp. 4572_84]RKZ63027.1 MAG: hypothetical protein DRR08_04475 [Gammaproteobacteria bacterium]